MQSTLYLSQNPFIWQLFLGQVGLATQSLGLILPWISDSHILFLTTLRGLCFRRRSWNDCTYNLHLQLQDFLPGKLPSECLSWDCFQNPYWGITVISCSLLKSSSNKFCSKFCDMCYRITGLIKNWFCYSGKLLGPC